MSQTGQYKRWNRDSTEAHKLDELFNLFKATDGKAGVDPDLSAPAQIRQQVYDAFLDNFKQINRATFHTNFRKTAALWKLNQHVTTGRKGKRIKCYFFLF